MFNMYDDQGVKLPIEDPYKVKALDPTNPINKYANKQKEKDNNEFEDFLDKDNFPNEAKDAYKKMANIHVEEDIYHASQLMSFPVITVQDNETIHECWLKMQEYDLKQIPIMGEHGKLKGLATMKNIAKSMIEHSHNTNYAFETKVNDIILRDIMTAEPITDIRRVAKVMVQYHLNCIPIISGNSDKLVGIVSRADILRAVSSNPHIQLWA